MDELNYALNIHDIGEGFTLKHDGYFEWEINDWENLKPEEFSPEFIACGYKWRVKLISKENNNENNEKCTSLALYNDDVLNNNFHVCANFILIIRHPNDYSCFYSKRYVFPLYFDKNIHCIDNNSVETKYLLEKNQRSKCIIDNNKAVVNVYIRTYKYENEQYIYNLKQLLNENSKEIDEEKEDYFEWKIEDWSEVMNEIESPEFFACNHKWKIILKLVESENKDSFTAYLKSMDEENENQKDINTCFVISLRNVNDYSVFDAKVLSYTFNKTHSSVEIIEFFEKNDLYRKSKASDISLIENNKFIIGGLIYVKEETENSDTEKS